MISYYELLGMIKEGKAPNQIRVHLTQSTSEIYEREDDIDGRFNLYYLYRTKTKNDEYKGYLTECYVESMMFDKNIEILGEGKEEKGIPEKINIELNSGDENKVNCYRATNLECDLAFKINEIIDYLNSKGE